MTESERSSIFPFLSEYHSLRTPPISVPRPSRQFLYQILNFPSGAICESLVIPSMNEKSINFHIAANDYFGTLATTLDLLRQAIEERGCQAKDADFLRWMTDDLKYLQNNHTIQ